MAADGYKRIDISNPSLDITDSHWTSQQYISWWVDSYGTVRNTGNVPLTDVSIITTYYDASGRILGSDRCYLDVYWLDPLPAGMVDTWSGMDGGWSSQPTRMDVRAEYNYVRVYRTKNKSKGALGLVIAGVGLVLVVDAAVTSWGGKRLFSGPVRVEPMALPEPALLLAYDF